MNLLFRFITLFVFIFFDLLNIQAQERMTYDKFLDEMVNLDRLTYLPDTHYQSLQFSSYDKKSISPYKKWWFSNSDGFGSESSSGFEEVLKAPGEDGIGEYLICDIQNPGVILRLWTAGINGDVRVFIDDMKIPLFKGRAEDFFWRMPEIITKGNTPKNIFRQYDAVYFPIPFSKRLRIEWIGDLRKIHFYHVGLRIYDKDIQVEPFKEHDFDGSFEIINDIINKFESVQTTNDKEFKRSEALAGETIAIWKAEGTKAIDSLYIRIDAENIENTLRQCILNIYFDDSEVPQVQAPIGDFFGAAPGINPYNSLAFKVNKDGTMVSYFKMPFKSHAKIEVKNLSNKKVSIYSNVKTKNYHWIEGKSMHFRTRWKMANEITSSNISIIDFPYLLAIGQGRIVGAATYIYNPSNVPTPHGNWWGEGDEKIFIDSSDSPRFFGTGSEDYYNYSWSSPRIFYFPYCGQPRNDGPGNRGYVANFRWHILDDIPFNNNIAFYMELFSHRTVSRFSYGSIIYYYALQGTIDDIQPISMNDIRDLPYYNWSPEAYGGALGYYFIDAEEIAKQTFTTTVVENKLSAGQKILMWQPKKENEQLRFILSDKNDNSKESVIGFTLAKMPEGGTFSVLVNGEKVKIGGKETISLFEENRTVLDNFFTEPVKFKNGKNEIEFVYKEKIAGKRIGVDFIWINK